jgi:hypothetical protein
VGVFPGGSRFGFGAHGAALATEGDGVGVFHASAVSFPKQDTMKAIFSSTD